MGLENITTTGISFIALKSLPISLAQPPAAQWTLNSNMILLHVIFLGLRNAQGLIWN